MPSHEELLKQIQIEADKQHFYWQVWNVAYYKGEPEKFQGIATKGKLFKIHIEEGAEPYWGVYGDYKTEDEALWALIDAVRLPPNHVPTHTDSRERELNPPKEIKGGPTIDHAPDQTHTTGQVRDDS